MERFRAGISIRPMTNPGAGDFSGEGALSTDAVVDNWDWGELEVGAIACDSHLTCAADAATMARVTKEVAATSQRDRSKTRDCSSLVPKFEIVDTEDEVRKGDCIYSVARTLRPIRKNPAASVVNMPHRRMSGSVLAV